MKTKYIPRYLFERSYLLGTLLFVVLFSIVFMNIYTPLSVTSWFGFENKEQMVLMLLFYLVVILILLVSKLLMGYVSKKVRISYIQYILWNASELVLISALYSMITTVFVLTEEYSFGMIFLKALMCLFLILAIPYSLALMYGIYNHQRKILKRLGYRSFISNEVTDGVEYINLTDNNGNLKLTLSMDSLYYLESQDNYVNVFYESGGKICHYMLRCKIKTIEDNFGGRLIRCHRSYVVNKSKIKLFKNERKGMYLELKYDGMKHIPVSKTYQEAVVGAISEVESFV